MKHWSYVLFLVLPFLFLPGCATQPVETPAATAPAPVPTLEPPRRLDAGLDELPGYRAWLVLKFEGEDAAGSPATARFTAIEEVDASGSRHLLARNDLGNQRPGSVDIYRLPQHTFLVSSELIGQSGCQRVDSALTPDQAALAPRPADILTAIHRGAQITANDQIGTIPARRYELAGLETALGRAKTVSGTLWYARDGKTLLRFTGSAEGALSLGGGATYGKVEWEYLLTDIGAVAIQLPSDCQAIAAADFPLPGDARNLLRAGSLLRFDSLLTPKEIIDFYRSELSTRGYDILVDSGGGLGFSLSGLREGKSLQVTVSVRESTSQVQITLP